MGKSAAAKFLRRKGRAVKAPKQKAKITAQMKKPENSDTRKAQKSEHERLHRQLAQLKKQDPEHQMLLDYKDAQLGGRKALAQFKEQWPWLSCSTGASVMELVVYTA